MDKLGWAVPLVAAILVAGGAWAADTTPADAPYIEPCKADAEKFCRGIDPADERIIGCLKEHREQVSDTCQARLSQMRVRPKPAPPKGAAAPVAK